MARCPRLCQTVRLEPPRRMKRNATAMSSSSSNDDDDEAEGTEGCKFQKRIRCIPEVSVTNKARGP